MRNAAYLFLLSILIFIAVPLAATPVQQQEKEILLAGLSSAEWKTRYEALERLKLIPPAELEPQLREALIRLLETEAQRRRDLVEKKISFEQYLPPGAQPMAFADYYQALIDIAAGLHDERALPMLVDYVSQPSGFDAELASYGARILGLVLSRLQGSTHEEVKAAMADILGKMLIQNRQHKLTPQLSEKDLEEIKESLRPVLSSPNWWTRLDAAFALALAGDRCDRERLRTTLSDLLQRPGERQFVLQKILQLPDAEFVPLSDIKHIGETDDFKVDLTNPYVRQKYTSEYPIRQMAHEVVKKFSKEN